MIKSISKSTIFDNFLEWMEDVVFLAQPIDAGKEYYIFHPFQKVIEDGGVMKVVSAQGKYLDAGTVEGWLHANQVVIAETHPANP
jgi:UTP-glucose-1-phosphate uridylyltransferase